MWPWTLTYDLDLLASPRQDDCEPMCQMSTAEVILLSEHADTQTQHTHRVLYSATKGKQVSVVELADKRSDCWSVIIWDCLHYCVDSISSSRRSIQHQAPTSRSHLPSIDRWDNQFNCVLPVAAAATGPDIGCRATSLMWLMLSGRSRIRIEIGLE